MNRIFTPVKIFAAIGVLATTALVLSFATGKTGDDDKNKKKKTKIEKRIEIVEENGEKKVTVTTIENGNKTVETFTGEKAEEYIRNNNGGAGQNFHMSFDFDIDTVLGRNSFDFSMNGFGKEFEEEMKKLFEELKSSQSQMQFDFDQMFKSMDSSFSQNNYNYSFNFDQDQLDQDLKELDSILKNIDINININGEDLDIEKLIEEEANQNGQAKKKTYIVTHSVVIEDMGKKGAEKDLHVSDVSFYPNPNGGNFTLRYKSESLDMIDITVSDMNGRKVYNERVAATGTVLRNIELNEPSGTYILTLQQGNKKLSKKLIIQWQCCPEIRSFHLF